MPQLKDIDKQGVAYSPHAYFVEEILLTNKDEEVIDIQGFITELSIQESIYSSTMVVTAMLKDASNLIEILPIYGFETIFVKMRRQQGPEGEEQIIERNFYITEYPVYGKARNEHLQAYQLKGITYHAWKNPLIKISRFYDAPIADEIVKIADDAFGLKVTVEGTPDPHGKGIINVQTPLQAIDWFRRRLFDPDGAPFYFYETLQSDPDQIFLTSHTEMANRPPHGEYFETRGYDQPIGTQEDYDEKKVKITESASTLNISKFNPIKTGTWASENNYIDIATRNFRKSFWKYPSDFPIDPSTILKTNILEPPITYEVDPNSTPEDVGEPPPDYVNIEAKHVSDEVFSHREHVSLNTEAFYKSPFQNYNVWSTGDYYRIPTINSFPNVFNALIHDITLYGDFELNAGSTIDLYFPKAMDPGQRTDAKEKPWDEHLSGRYIVISVVHRFKNQEYHMNLRVKRDSIVQDGVAPSSATEEALRDLGNQAVNLAANAALEAAVSSVIPGGTATLNAVGIDTEIDVDVF